MDNPAIQAKDQQPVLMVIPYVIIGLSTFVSLIIVIFVFVQQVSTARPLSMALPMGLWLLLVLMIPIVCQIAILAGLYKRKIVISILAMLLLAGFTYATGFTVGGYLIYPAAVTLLGLIIGVGILLTTRHKHTQR